MAGWFYQIDGRETGPIDTTELKRLASCGELVPTSLIRKEEMTEWVPASKAKGLFPSHALPPLLQTAAHLSSAAVQPVKNRGDLNFDTQTLHTSLGLPETTSIYSLPVRRTRTQVHNLLLYGLGSVLLVIVSFNAWYFCFRTPSKSGRVVLGKPIGTDVEYASKILMNELASATIHGGAWLTNKAGQSEPVRGLNIFVIRKTLTTEQKTHSLQVRMAKCQARIDARQKKLDELQKFGDTGKSSVILKDLLEGYRKELDGIEKSRLEIKDGVVGPHEMLEAVNAQKELASQVSTSITSDSVAKIHTNVDGKYQASVPTGSYFAYATHDSAYSKVEWMIPFEIGETDGASIDFHNDTAIWITNK